MATLPSDIIPEILRRLGVKDLLRFRCVSKPWCSLIDDPGFIKLHISHFLRTSTHLLLVLRDRYLFSVDFDSLKAAEKLNNPFFDGGAGTEILGSCNGLLALRNGQKEIALWNPSTRKSQMLPLTKIEFQRCRCIPKFIVYGLGHDPISGDYKLVRMVQFYPIYGSNFHCEVKVYSLRTNSWGRIKDFPFCISDIGAHEAHGVLANNALHWVVYTKPRFFTRILVAFDLGSEEYRVFELLNRIKRGSGMMNVKSIGGSLCLIASKVHAVEIWMMEDYGVEESWTKLVSVNQSMLTSPFNFVLPLAFSKNGDRVLLNIDDKKFAWYDLSSKRVKKVRIEGVPSSFEASEMLVQSLVPLNGNGAMINKKEHAKEKQKKKNTKRDDFLSKGFTWCYNL